MKTNVLSQLSMIGVLALGSVWAACAKKTTPTDAEVGIVDAPACIQRLIHRVANEPVANPPVRIQRFEYKGLEVFDYSPGCCDQFAVAYDEECNEVCRPAGGITGQGDGKCPDFYSAAVLKGTVWHDPRSYMPRSKR